MLVARVITQQAFKANGFAESNLRAFRPI
jgi:hypothetical protein